MKDMLLRQLKQEKIFGYSNYTEFFNDYFRKQLVAVEDLNRIRQLKEARQRYEKRWNSNNPVRAYGLSGMADQG